LGRQKKKLVGWLQDVVFDTEQEKKTRKINDFRPETINRIIMKRVAKRAPRIMIYFRVCVWQAFSAL